MRLHKKGASVLAASVIALGVAGPSAAQGRLASTHEDWKVFIDESGGDRVCYALSDPVDRAPRTVDHGRVAFMVSTWRSGAATEQPSFHAGYELRANSPTRARVGSTRYRMYVDGREGFIEQDEDERQLIRDMKRGFAMRVEAVSARGTATAYEFSLRGVTSALNAVEDACG